MDMSMIEVTGRANFLIYDYIKRRLNHNDLAEQFRKVIQDSAHNHKDIIIFKGLEDLTQVLMRYYSSQGVAAAGEPNGPAAEADAKAEAEAVAGSEDKGDRKKKKKKKKVTEEPADEQQSQSEAVAEPAAEPEKQLAEEADTNAEKQKKKKKKKKRHAETESVAAEQPEEAATNGQEAAMQPEEAAEAEEAPRKKRKKHKAATADESADFNDASQANGHQAGKEVERGSDDDATATVVAETEADGVADADCGISGGKKQKRHSQPYRRVREEEVVNKHFHDNSFDAKPGAPTGWGYKANEDLRPTQGRSFRHEKTKKKRGSYKGGAIDTGVSSFKFDSDSN